MATRSSIAIQNDDGTVTGIYCHWDGYLSHNGRILNVYYNTENQVRELIALGDLSSLGENIGEKVDFNNAPEGQCVAYGRDGGEDNVEAYTAQDWASFINQTGQEYDYLYVPGEGWRVRFHGSWDLIEGSLEEALDKENEE